MSFVNSTPCASRAHCHACRNSRTFRETIFRAGKSKEVDFTDCPEGWPIGFAVPGTRKPVIVLNGEMKVKGPLIWKKWHALADAGQFPGDDFETILRDVPCGECRRHAREALVRRPFRPDDQSAWMVDFHNEIRRALNQEPWGN